MNHRGTIVGPVLAALWAPLLTAQTPPESPATLRPGDVISIQVRRQPELSGEFLVGDAGAVAHPIYRNVFAWGKSVEEIQSAVRSTLLTFQADPNFVVEAR